MSDRPKRKRGRQTVYTEALAAEICERLEHGESLNRICRDEHMPTEGCVRDWVSDDREGFNARYAKARERGYARLADELLDIADDGSNDWMEREGHAVPNGELVARSRLRLDTRKWLLSKMLPKLYGDKQQDGDATQPITIVVRRFEEDAKDE